MKNTVPKTPYHATNALREAVAAYDKTHAEADRVQTMERDCRAERERIIKSGDIENTEIIRKASDCEIKAGMCAQKRLQLLEIIPDLVVDVSKELLWAIMVLAPVVGLARESVAAHARKTLLPLFDDNEKLLKDRPANVASLVGEMPATLAFQIETSFLSTPRPDEDYVIPRARDFLASFERLEAALKKYSAMLPGGFAATAFPQTREEFLARVPANYKTGFYVRPADMEPTAASPGHLPNNARPAGSQANLRDRIND